MQRQHLQDLILRIGPPDGLVWGVANAGEGDLFDIEARAVDRAVPGRRAEFTAGRMAARRAMAQLGLPAMPVPAGPDRAPIWPEGLVGSISHFDGLCLAVVARADRFGAVGVDIEGDAPLDTALIPEICLESELDDTPQPGRAALAKRLFSAKEAAYKASYPRTRRVFGFHGLHIDLREGRARFTDHPEVAAIPPDSRADLDLRQVIGGGLILSLSLVAA